MQVDAEIGHGIKYTSKFPPNLVYTSTQYRIKAGYLRYRPGKGFTLETSGAWYDMKGENFNILVYPGAGFIPIKQPKVKR